MLHQISQVGGIGGLATAICIFAVSHLARYGFVCLTKA